MLLIYFLFVYNCHIQETDAILILFLQILCEIIECYAHDLSKALLLIIVLRVVLLFVDVLGRLSLRDPYSLGPLPADTHTQLQCVLARVFKDHLRQARWGAECDFHDGD